MKRIYKNDMPDSQKAHISQSLKGRKHSEEHKLKISQALEKYWSALPKKPTTPDKPELPDHPYKDVPKTINDIYI